MNERRRGASRSSFSSWNSQETKSSNSSVSSPSKKKTLKTKPDEVDWWIQISSKILPLFNGEGTIDSMEDLNEELVSFIDTTRKPVNLLLNDISDIIEKGVYSMKTKFNATLNEERIIARFVELWSFHIGSLVPHLEGVFLPVQNYVEDQSEQSNTIKALCLISFKENIIFPNLERLENALRLAQSSDQNHLLQLSNHGPKLLQMLKILASLDSSDQQIQYRLLQFVQTLSLELKKEKPKPA